MSIKTGGNTNGKETVEKRMAKTQSTQKNSSQSQTG
jgi:hypothetical protein